MRMLGNCSRLNVPMFAVNLAPSADTLDNHPKKKKKKTTNSKHIAVNYDN